MVATARTGVVTTTAQTGTAVPTQEAAGLTAVARSAAVHSVVVAVVAVVVVAAAHAAADTNRPQGETNKLFLV
jgi:hypothetical protein